MSFFGAYFGADEVVVSTSTTTTPSPVASPYVPAAPEFLDHVLTALNRLPEQFKAKNE